MDLKEKTCKLNSVLGCKIDFYFYDCKLAVEIDELEHKDRNIDHEIKRQRAIEK